MRLIWWLISVVLCSYGLSVSAVSSEQMEILSAAMKKVIPDLDMATVKVSQIGNSNLYKVMNAAEVFYVSQDGKYFIYGELINLDIADRSNWNITDTSKRELRKAELNNFPTKNMLVFKPNGHRLKADRLGAVTIFTDLDCPYCNKLHKEVEKAVASGLEVRYVMFPRAGLGSSSYNKSVSVWCAKNHNQAFTMANNGESVPEKTCKNNSVENQMNFGRKLGVHATPTIMLGNGKLIPGFMSANDLIKLAKETDARSSGG